MTTATVSKGTDMRGLELRKASCLGILKYLLIHLKQMR
jgi:hypothetical protein